MARHKIVHYRVQEQHDRVLMADFLTWPEDEKITISNGFDYEQAPIGHASDLRREKDGTITAEIEMYYDITIPKNLIFSVFVARVKFDKWKGLSWLTDGIILGISLVPDEALKLKPKSVS